MLYQSLGAGKAKSKSHFPHVLFLYSSITKLAKYLAHLFLQMFFPICCSELSSAPASFWQTKSSLLIIELFASELAPVCLMTSNSTLLVCQILHQLQKATSNLFSLPIMVGLLSTVRNPCSPSPVHGLNRLLFFSWQILGCWFYRSREHKFKKKYNNLIVIIPSFSLCAFSFL